MMLPVVASSESVVLALSFLWSALSTMLRPSSVLESSLSPSRNTISTSVVTSTWTTTPLSAWAASALKVDATVLNVIWWSSPAATRVTTVAMWLLPAAVIPFTVILPPAGPPMRRPAPAVAFCSSARVMCISFDVDPKPTVWSILEPWMSTTSVPAVRLPLKSMSQAVMVTMLSLLVTVLVSTTVKVPSPATS